MLELSNVASVKACPYNKETVLLSRNQSPDRVLSARGESCPLINAKREIILSLVFLIAVTFPTL